MDTPISLRARGRARRRLVVNRLAESGRTRLPVLDPAGHVVGIVALEHLLQARVRNLVEEHRRERPLALARG